MGEVLGGWVGGGGGGGGGGGEEKRKYSLTLQFGKDDGSLAT